MIPNSWEAKKLCELAVVKGGKRIPKGKSLTTEDTGFPYIRVTDMYLGGVDTSKILFVPTDVEPEIKNYKISKNDLFISVAGTLGIVGKIPDELDNANLTENANKITNITCNKDYLLYFLMSQDIQNEIKNTSTSNAQPKLALEKIRDFTILLPPINEQIKIAEILDTCENSIRITNDLITKNLLRKNSLMENLLTGKKRFKEFEHEEMKVVCFTDVAEIIHGYQFRDSDFVEQGIPIIKIGNLSDGGDLLFKNLSYIDSDRLTEFEDCVIKQDDVLMALSGATIGKVTYVKNEIGTYLQNYRVGKFGCSTDKISKKYLYYILQSDFVQSRIIALLNAGAQPNIGKADFDKIFFPLPSLIEQDKITEMLFYADDEINKLKSQLEKLRLQKNGLMNLLLTGKVRVKI